jgi:hypothetical protein
MSAEDFKALKHAADTLWLGAPITNSSIVLGLAKLGAADGPRAFSKHQLILRAALILASTGTVVTARNVLAI